MMMMFAIDVATLSLFLSVSIAKFTKNKERIVRWKTFFLSHTENTESECVCVCAVQCDVELRTSPFDKDYSSYR